MELSTILTSTLLAAGVSASVAAIFQVVVKDKEYRNDYYKKVIEKRLKAVELVERILALFSTHTRIIEGDSIIYDFFVKYPRRADEDVFVTALKEVAEYGNWLSPTSEKCAKDFTEKVTYLRNDSINIKDAEELAKYYITGTKTLSVLKVALEQSIARDMATLYKVNAFFRARRRAASKNLIK